MDIQGKSWRHVSPLVTSPMMPGIILTDDRAHGKENFMERCSSSINDYEAILYSKIQSLTYHYTLEQVIFFRWQLRWHDRPNIASSRTVPAAIIEVADLSCMWIKMGICARRWFLLSFQNRVGRQLFLSSANVLQYGIDGGLYALYRTTIEMEDWSV